MMELVTALRGGCAVYHDAMGQVVVKYQGQDSDWCGVYRFGVVLHFRGLGSLVVDALSAADLVTLLSSCGFSLDEGWEKGKRTEARFR
jgi:hypothetical protein